MEIVELLRRKFEALRPGLSEVMCRRWAATEARALGRGGISRVVEATGLTAPTIRRGLQELKAGVLIDVNRSRRAGGGRIPRIVHDPALLVDLEALVDPATRGDPESPLLWTCKSTPLLARSLRAKGHTISHQTVGRLLHALGYSLQANRKTLEGTDHPDRNAQFEYIAARVRDFQQRNQPVISVDTKKKELVGNYKNGGREWESIGCPPAVRGHDFPDPELGKAIPYGIWDQTRNEGWVTVGTDHDTPAFAVAAIRQWWTQMGAAVYPRARELLVTADNGGSNSSRVRLWKVELQRFADASGLRIRVCHFPPGTSKWNKIEHRMFCHITQNWRGRPLVSYEVIVNLIASTTTQTGLTIQTKLDRSAFPTGIRVSDRELASVKIEPDAFHGNWNYIIKPAGGQKQKS